jgi:N-acyl-D-aspartate/D-glutamate deacylase
MGERGAKNQPATPADIAAMAALVKEGIAAGAFGFSTSRTIAHRAIDGEPVPGTFAAEDELFGIGRVLGELGRGIFELAGAGAAGEDIAAPKREIDWMRRLSAEIRRPVTFTLLQVNAAPDLWREQFELSVAALNEGAQIYPQVAGRPFGLMIGHQTKIHPFGDRPSYVALLSRTLDERVRAMRFSRSGIRPSPRCSRRSTAARSRSARRRTTSRATRIRSRRSRSGSGAMPRTCSTTSCSRTTGASCY